jgi:hypothetical protein
MNRIVALLLSAVLLGAFSGCRKPEVPTLTGPGMLMDISQVKQGMSPNEVRRIMGSRYKLITEEGIQGIDGGNYAWEYSQGRVYFNYEGVTRVVNFAK